MMEASVASDHNVATAVNHWPRLSDEMVLFILSHLPRKDLVKVSKVSKKFRDLSRDDSLWTDLTLDCKDIKRKADSCRKLVERCKKLAILKISNRFVNSTVNIMTVVIRAKESLKSLEVNRLLETWTPAAMAKLGQMKNLSCLTMDFNSDALKVNGYAGAKMLEDLAKLDKLEVLNLVISHREEGFHPRSNSLPSMKNVFQTLKKLKNVNISLPDSNYDESLVVTLAKNSPDLTSLRFMNYPPLSEESVDILASSCPSLQELNIRFRDGGSDINKLSSSFPNLKQLFVRGCEGLDNEKLIEFEKFKMLEKLELQLDIYISNTNKSITDSGIERMVNAAKKLKNLRMWGWYPNVTRDFVKRMRIEYPDLVLRINSY